jgi:hypothetical protein
MPLRNEPKNLRIGELKKMCMPTMLIIIYSSAKTGQYCCWNASLGTGGESNAAGIGIPALGISVPF